MNTNDGGAAIAAAIAENEKMLETARERAQTQLEADLKKFSAARDDAIAENEKMRKTAREWAQTQLEANLKELSAARDDLYKKKMAADRSDSAATEKARAAVVLARFHEDAYASIRAHLDAHGTTMSVRCDGDRRSESIHFRFVHKDTVVSAELWMHGASSGNLCIEAEGHACVSCELLSVHNQADWTSLATMLHINDGILGNLCVFTEFLVSLVSPLMPAQFFETFFGTVMRTHTVDGAQRYSGHGGTMAVTFPCTWAESGPARFCHIYK